MRLPAHHGRTLSFNFTSLIDMVFLLNIFFIVAASLAREEADSTVNLPSATQHEDEDDRNRRRLTVTVSAAGELRELSRPISFSQFEEKIQQGSAANPGQFEVRIRADRSAAYEHVQPLLVSCAKNRVARVSFAVTSQ